MAASLTTLLPFFVFAVSIQLNRTNGDILPTYKDRNSLSSEQCAISFRDMR